MTCSMHQLILVFSVLATRVLPQNKYTTFFVFSSSLAKMYSIDRLAIQKMKFGFRSSNIRIKFTLNNWCLTPLESKTTGNFFMIIPSTPASSQVSLTAVSNSDSSNSLPPLGTIQRFYVSKMIS